MEEAQYSTTTYVQGGEEKVWLYGLDGFDDADKGQKLKHVSQTIMQCQSLKVLRQQGVFCLKMPLLQDLCWSTNDSNLCFAYTVVHF